MNIQVSDSFVHYYQGFTTCCLWCTSNKLHAWIIYNAELLWITLRPAEGLKCFDNPVIDGLTPPDDQDQSSFSRFSCLLMLWCVDSSGSSSASGLIPALITGLTAGDSLAVEVGGHRLTRGCELYKPRSNQHQHEDPQSDDLVPQPGIFNTSDLLKPYRLVEVDSHRCRTASDGRLKRIRDGEITAELWGNTKWNKTGFQEHWG